MSPCTNCSLAVPQDAQRSERKRLLDPQCSPHRAVPLYPCQITSSTSTADRIPSNQSRSKRNFHEVAGIAQHPAMAHTGIQAVRVMMLSIAIYTSQLYLLNAVKWPSIIGYRLRKLQKHRARALRGVRWAAFPHKCYALRCRARPVKVGAAGSIQLHKVLPAEPSRGIDCSEPLILHGHRLSNTQIAIYTRKPGCIPENL